MKYILDINKNKIISIDKIELKNLILSKKEINNLIH
jgi:hypothetical protein